MLGESEKAGHIAKKDLGAAWPQDRPAAQYALQRQGGCHDKPSLHASSIVYEQVSDATNQCPTLQVGSQHGPGSKTRSSSTQRAWPSPARRSPGPSALYRSNTMRLSPHEHGPTERLGVILPAIASRRTQHQDRQCPGRSHEPCRTWTSLRNSSVQKH